ncbi:COX15/CtaA family protein [Acidipropionibacterium virtanenii]|uniref:Heme A synthase n=1 Tax=Acidipropionibacterium virtanenii TaxID=2057246 RepID=A0A344UT04_9ACTN|nr:COX15/CtaA family protein [Acidipropionibacterium virtanenii]AXE38402.1 Heme A synthase [Acidipropionibacterium virtanenii]
MGVLSSAVSSRTALYRWSMATLAGNMILVVTGAVVRLTGSGLGCPTWPHCAAGSFVPHSSMGIHSVIEFGNRLLTFVLVILSVMLVITATLTRASGRVRSLAWVVLVSIPLQAVVGGLTVLSDLNPFVVALHLLLSVAIILVAVKIVWLVGRRPSAEVDSMTMGAVRGTVALMAIVMWLGTVVTGSGPNAGDSGAHRTGFAIETVARLHGISVWLTIGLTVICLLLGVMHKAGPLRRWALILLIVEFAQGAVGYAQYFAHLDPWLVALHMVGVAAASMAVGALWSSVRPLRTPDLSR